MDNIERSEWIESIDNIIDKYGISEANKLLDTLYNYFNLSDNRSNSDYKNSIDAINDIQFPGDIKIEERILHHIIWNAVCMVSGANKDRALGGHISTYSSISVAYEVAFNHFFKVYGDYADNIFFQGHSSPGIYARAFLEGRLSKEHLNHFRVETNKNGLSSYPHPRSMPHFWQFPTVSMGLGVINSIYQAKFNKYLYDRNIKDTSKVRVWGFFGDGEMDEPESLGALSIASTNKLNNLTFIINCNLQRLDGPVDGNTHIIEKLSSIFSGNGWRVIKVVWGTEWDKLFVKDNDRRLINKLNNITDGDIQYFYTDPSNLLLKHIFNDGLEDILNGVNIDNLIKGGCDYNKVFNAMNAAVKEQDKPTVILLHTIKGWKLGQDIEGKNVSHNIKSVSYKSLIKLRDRLNIDISDIDIKNNNGYCKLKKEDEDYLIERRLALGGYIPKRMVKAKLLNVKDIINVDKDDIFSTINTVKTTTSGVVNIINKLIKSKIGNLIVPIIPDEGRTFGLEFLYSRLKIYNRNGQQYIPVDKNNFITYSESLGGQILQEGISECGAMGSFIAAATSYATHGQYMIPIYMFYSMFGFQRVGDSLWALGDQLGKGFVIGALAGRTTIQGEGLQHCDGHSPLLSATNPACMVYDPAYIFELECIVMDGIYRMYEKREDIFYYITVYNEAIIQVKPQSFNKVHLLKGMYLFNSNITNINNKNNINILASGIAVSWSIEAQKRLLEEHNINSNLWSVTSWNLLYRDGINNKGMPFIKSLLKDSPYPVLAVTDYMRLVPDQISRWIDYEYFSMGTDGFGISDTYDNMRDYYNISIDDIVNNAVSLINK